MASSRLLGAWNGSVTVRFRATIDIDYSNLVRRGSAAQIGAVLGALGVPGDPVVVSDDTVAAHHAAAVLQSLRAAGRDPKLLTVPPGEHSKSPGTAARLIDRMLATGVHRRSLLLALGGGVICDLVGYVAATYMRGLAYVCVPTSLLAQIDAAIGGKVAVNHPRVKNFIGAFHHPAAVVIDPSLLGTLPVDEMRNGLAEAVKVGVIRSADLFARIEREGERLLDAAGGGPAIDGIIVDAVRAKIELLEPDPFERDLRRVLNFGHTFAHALEAAESFGLRHGYAVAIGMSIATRIALARRRIAAGDAARIEHLVNRLGLPTDEPAADPVVVWDHAEPIRRIRANRLHYVIPTGIGSAAIINDLTRAEFLTAWRARTNGRRGASSLAPPRLPATDDVPAV